MWRLHSYDEKDLNFHELDRRVIQIKDDDISTLPNMVSYFTSLLPKDNANMEIYLARAFLIWLREVIRRKLANETPNVPDEIADLLKQNYKVNMFEAFCKSAKIEFVIVQGIAKGVGYRAGDTIDKAVNNRSAWSVFKCNGTWNIVGGLEQISGHKLGDETMLETDGKIRVEKEMAADGTQLASEDDLWFCPNPEIFAMDHYPDEAKWQLLPQEKMIDSIEEFLALPCLNHAYFQLSIHLLSAYTCMLNSTKGRSTIRLMASGKQSLHTRFNYRLSIIGDTTDLPNSDNLPLLVSQTREEGIISFEVRFPIVGIYLLRIFAGTPEMDAHSNCCDFHLTCTEVDPNLKKLPIDTGSNGFGFNNSAGDAGLTRPSTAKAKLVVKPSEEGNDRGKIAFNLDEDIANHTEYLSTVYGSKESDDGDIVGAEFQDLTKAKVVDDANKLVVDVGLKTEGEFCLAIGSRRKHTKDTFILFMYYLVHSSADVEDDEAMAKIKRTKRKAIYEEKMSRKKKIRDDLQAEINEIKGKTEEHAQHIISEVESIVDDGKDTALAEAIDTTDIEIQTDAPQQISTSHGETQTEVELREAETDTDGLVVLTTFGAQAVVDTKEQYTQMEENSKSAVCTVI